MQFRLIYRGKLPAETNKPRVEDKRRIRSQIHPQLKALISSHRMLTHAGSIYAGKYFRAGAPQVPEEMISFWEASGDQYKVVGSNNYIHRFAPLITERNYNGCSLDVLFLRRDIPGGIVRHGGDIDNRLKVLFDALRMLRETLEVEDVPQATEGNAR
jgi:hypothetical protein